MLPPPCGLRPQGRAARTVVASHVRLKTTQVFRISSKFFKYFDKILKSLETADSQLTGGEGPPLPLGSVRGGPPAWTCWDIYGATFARFGRAILEPVHLLATSAVSKAPV